MCVRVTLRRDVRVSKVREAGPAGTFLRGYVMGLLISNCFVIAWDPGEGMPLVVEPVIYLSKPEIGRADTLIEFKNAFAAKRYIKDRCPAFKPVTVAA